MLNRFNLKGDFVKNILILITGTGFAQAIPLVFSPLLTRIFSPSDFGRLAFFMALCAIVALLSTGLYELAIMLPKKDVAAFNILVLVVILSFSICLVLLLLLLAFGSSFSRFINSPIQSNFLLFLPLGVFFTGTFQALNYWLNRKKQYKIINACKIAQSIGTVITSILCGYFGYKAHGLIIGFLMGGAFSIVPLIFIILKRYGLISKRLIIESAKTYFNYPKIMMPTSIMNTAASQAPIFFINKFYSSVIVGGFSFATRILTAPIGIISSAIGQVYYQKISEIVNLRSSKIFLAFITTAKSLTLISVLLFAPLFFWGAEIFRIVFGEEWVIAGEYVEIISIAVFIKFIVSPLSTIFLSTNDLYTVGFWQSLYFCTTISVFLLFKDHIFKSLLWIYTAHEVVLYSFYFVLMIVVSRRFDNKSSKELT
jgi:teichuronic acid exporter